MNADQNLVSVLYYTRETIPNLTEKNTQTKS